MSDHQLMLTSTQAHLSSENETFNSHSWIRSETVNGRWQPFPQLMMYSTKVFEQRDSRLASRLSTHTPPEWDVTLSVSSSTPTRGIANQSQVFTASYFS